MPNISIWNQVFCIDWFKVEIKCQVIDAEDQVKWKWKWKWKWKCMYELKEFRLVYEKEQCM